MEKHEQVLRDLLINKTLNDIEFFDTDLKYISPDMEHIWIVDGGVQLKTDNDFFSFAFTSKEEFFNAFPLKIDELKNHFKVKSLGALDVEAINSLIGNKIVEIKVIWNSFVEYDEDINEKAEKGYMPVEILIFFNNNSFIQIAAIEYKIRENKIADIAYCSEYELLISVNQKIEIKNIS